MLNRIKEAFMAFVGRHEDTAKAVPQRDIDDLIAEVGRMAWDHSQSFRNPDTVMVFEVTEAELQDIEDQFAWEPNSPLAYAVVKEAGEEPVIETRLYGVALQVVD